MTALFLYFIFNAPSLVATCERERRKYRKSLHVWIIKERLDEITKANQMARWGLLICKYRLAWMGNQIPGRTWLRTGAGGWPSSVIGCCQGRKQAPGIVDQYRQTDDCLKKNLAESSSGCTYFILFTHPTMAFVLEKSCMLEELGWGKDDGGKARITGFEAWELTYGRRWREFHVIFPENNVSKSLWWWDFHLPTCRKGALGNKKVLRVGVVFEDIYGHHTDYLEANRFQTSRTYHGGNKFIPVGRVSSLPSFSRP